MRFQFLVRKEVTLAAEIFVRMLDGVAPELLETVDNVVGMARAATGWLPPITVAAAQSLPDVAVMLNASRLLRRR